MEPKVLSKSKIFAKFSKWFLRIVCSNRFDTLRLYFPKSNFNFGRHEFLMAVSIDNILQTYGAIYVGVNALTFLKRLCLPYSGYPGPFEMFVSL